MSNKGQAKVSRRRFNLETVVFSAQQEVTVPAGIKIPADTQYLLQPVLVMPAERRAIQTGPGKIRVTGQLEGFLSCVDDNEAVHSLAIPPLEFMAGFAAPNLPKGAKIEADAVIDAVEVDRGDDNVANITAFVQVSVRASVQEETELVSSVTGDSLSPDPRVIKLQHILKEVEAEKSLKIQVGKVGDIVATDLCIGNLSWQVVDGQLNGEGVAMLKLYHLTDQGTVGITNASKEFGLELDFDSPEVADSTLKCDPVSVSINTTEEGADVELTLKAKGLGYREQAGDYLADLQGADSIRKDLHIRNRIGESEFKVNLEGNYQLPLESGVVDTLIPRVRVLEVKALDEKVMVRGLLTLNLYYKDEDLNRVYVQEQEFTQFFDLKGCESGFKVRVWAWPEAATCYEGKYMAALLLRVEVYDEVEFSAVTDVHVIDPGLTPPNASVILYIVRKGDNLFTIARKFNITKALLLDYNGINEDSIYPGQKILVPVYMQKIK